MNYGRFSDDGREFIIERPDTPRPWINCLTNGTHCALVSQTGGGYSFIGGPGYDRITRANPDVLTSDRPGRYVFIRDNVQEQYFSIGWQPVKRQPEWFECRHSPGMTSIASVNLGIRGRITFFVPLDDNIEIWRVSIKNLRDEQADLSVFTYVEWVLGNFSDDLEDRELSNLFNDVRFQDNYIVATKRSWRRPESSSVALRGFKFGVSPMFLPETITSNQSWGKYAFIATTVPVDGFDCDREVFLGRYGDLTKPRGLESGRCFNSEGLGRDAVGVLQVRLTVPPHGFVHFDVILGVVLHPGDPSGVLGRYTEPGAVDLKLESLKSYWDSHLSKLTISTPDKAIDRSFNIWDRYENWIAARLPGVPSLYRAGSSVVGFRESCYALMGSLPIEPEFSKQGLARLTQRQYHDGSIAHSWEPRSVVGVRTGHLDDPIWLVMSIINYLKETGDLAFLNNTAPYYYSKTKATIYEHMVRALDYCLSQISTGRLSLLGPGDWNEALDQAGRGGRGESILTSMMLCQALADAAQAAMLIGDRSRARSWRARARLLKKRINETAWDGSWYIRATTDHGERIGSASSTAARIFLSPQCLSVISRIASESAAVQVMDAVRNCLDTPHGPALFLPAYSRPDRNIGLLTRFAPGTCQNGGINLIAACWAVIAECVLGRGARAYEIFKKLSPAAAQEDQDVYQAEPYVRSEYVTGPDSDKPGCGSLTWSAGCAAWTWRTCLDWICGVHPDYDGLRINPCIPPHWDRFQVIRPFRGALYNIEVHNPDGIETGVRNITVDSKAVPPSRHIPDFRDGKTHQVIVTMGM